MDSLNGTLVLVIILFIIWVATVIARRARTNTLQRLLATGQFAEFYRLLGATTTRLLYPGNTLASMNLDALMLQGDDKQTEVLLDRMLRRKLGRRQRMDLVLKAFNFYVGTDEAKRSRELLAEIESWGQQYDPIKYECRQLYDVLIAGKSSHIDEMESQLDSVDTFQRGKLEYLLAVQYEHAGNHAKRDEYLSRAKRDGGLEKTPDATDTPHA
ncbi:hypothetical protein [Enorma phocaeensis]|uniref:Uncharacterized protein n=1 Tax=Enorma phocaeensis TaxID=1871019 RepID=A0ABT7V956_9ACTN|nr:hypothetical protein [Enorma phocaeensis]MDM8275020.1 hypothetical protein [Enorma phocaeensis]